MRKVIYLRQAISFIDGYFIWYAQNMSYQSASKFSISIRESVERLSRLPDIGRLEPKYNRKGYIIRSYLVYKHYRIFYRYNEEELVIIAFWDMRGFVR